MTDPDDAPEWTAETFARAKRIEPITNAAGDIGSVYAEPAAQDDPAKGFRALLDDLVQEIAPDQGNRGSKAFGLALAVEATATRQIAGLRKAYAEQVRDHIATSAALKDAEADAARVREALAPSGDTKAAYLGEFKMPFTSMHCNDDDEWEEVTDYVTVTWDVIKEIMAAISSRAALAKDTPQ